MRGSRRRAHKNDPHQEKSMKKTPGSNVFVLPHRLTLMAASIAAVMAASAQAQQAEKPPAKAEDSSQLETIVVTATKRAEPLQTVPIAISVISGERLEQANLNTLGAITSQAPTVNFRANASNKDTSLFIRGVGTISTSPGVEPTVSTVIDGVVYARPGQATLDLMEVDRVEVLRGPQGTLFGKNASAGVINIVSKPLSSTTERFVDAAYYQGNEKRLRAGVSGELTSGVLGSFAAMVGEYDGNVKNVLTGDKVNGYDRKGVRGKLEINPSKDLKATIIADYSKADDTGTRGPFVRSSAAIAASLRPIVLGPENRDIATNVKERVEDTNSGISAQVDWGLGGATLTSITAWREWKNVQFQDIDGTGPVYSQIAGLSDRGQLKSQQISQELRIASPTGAFFEYVGGLFYMRTKTDEVYRRDVARCATNAPALPSTLIPCATLQLDNGVATYGTLGKSGSLFGESKFNFTSALRGILGLRYTKDDLSYYHGRVSTAAVQIPGVRVTRPNTTGATSQNGVSGRVGPQFDLSKEATVYATYSKGYKGPAYNAFFNMSAIDDFALAPEKSTGYELGLKSTLFDNRLRLNLAAFDTKYTGYQANFPDIVSGTVVTRFINAGDVSTKGFEMDFEAKLGKQFTLAGAVANTKARVDRFNCPVGATCPSLNGATLPSAPEWKLNVRANYNMPLGNGLKLDLGTDYSYQTRTQFDLSTSLNTVQPAYGIVNASVALSSAASGWRVALLGKNLADKSYAAFLLPGANTQRSVPRDDQRYFGINARLDF
jgi:iron complex outermembrane recepter protein